MQIFSFLPPHVSAILITVILVYFLLHCIVAVSHTHTMLRSLLAPTRRNRFIFKETIWLGGRHDGYPLTSFDEYLKVRGAPATDGMDPIAHSALYQSLFTFGLLESVMEVKIPESTLLRQDAEGKIMMTDRYLPDLLQNWRHRIRRSDQSCQRQWADRVQKTLRQMYVLLLLEITRPKDSVFLTSGHSMEEVASIFRLIACIAEAAMSSRRVFSLSTQTQNIPFSWTFLLPPGSDHMTKIMVSNGWCPFTIAILSQNVCALSYASTRKPYIRDDVEGHHRCTMSACVINMIDTSSYSNRHAVEGCTCAYSKPSLERVCGSLENRENPVVHQLQPNDGLISSDGSKTRYIAISHVWADGLGNTTEIGLPACQINRLAGIARRLIPSGAFWMDALCVPEKRDLRKRAIGLMAETYRNADAVLVIDSGIRSCSRSAPLEERLLQIISSGWMQRLWTLQEALLARKLIFEFADGFATLDELIPKGEDLADVLLTQLSAEIFRLIKYQHYATSDGFGIGDVAKSLRWRTTSRAGDETLAISGLLNVDAFELVNLPASQRIMTLFLRVQKLPSDIIFMPGPKLNEHGFRWAPRTMMTSMQISMSISDQYDASCTSRGLLAEYAAVYFETDTTLKGGVERFIRDNSKQRIYKITDVASDIEEYSFNVLLLIRLPRSSEMVYCVACQVVVDEGLSRDTDRNRFTCVYQRRLFLTDISEYELKREKSDIVLGAKSARMRVLMT
ncbi:hypothetical protein IW261DRAFT_1612086 [Armillaria novae-zelandiae]|uniref:Heterokaryon incompatibility domain-containing protein n=1 Tax=Armillaria novae-zelandiae TaxID=153914 RepID=A0AA39UAA9_9AGAR|nr:hypothetical protein IW261DRAFT_1612086 [Armillaria novae-zelandiae]